MDGPEAAASVPASGLPPGFEEVVREELRGLGRRLVAEHKRRLSTSGAASIEDLSSSYSSTHRRARGQEEEGQPALPSAVTFGDFQGEAPEDSYDASPSMRSEASSKTARRVSFRISEERASMVEDLLQQAHAAGVQEAANTPLEANADVYCPCNSEGPEGRSVSKASLVESLRRQLHPQYGKPDEHEHPLAVPHGDERCASRTRTDERSPSKCPSLQVPGDPHWDFRPRTSQTTQHDSADGRTLSSRGSTGQDPLKAGGPRMETPTNLQVVPAPWPGPARSVTLHTVMSSVSVKSLRSSVSKRDLLGVSGADVLSQNAVDEMSFAVLPLWSQRTTAFATTCLKLRSGSTISSRSEHSSLAAPTVSVFPVTSKSRSPILSPNSARRLMWDIMSIACIIHDAIVAPLEFLQVPRSPAMLTLDWATRVFWTVDVAMTFLTGIQQTDGSVEMRREKIAQHYLCTWLIPDLVIVLSDWTEVFLDEAATASQLIGLLRMLRLVRLLRLQKLVSVAAERARTERVSLLLSLAGSVGAIVGVAHAMASAWLGLGRNSPMNWVTMMGLPETEYFDQYLLALHWSLTNFAGSMDLQPQTAGERVYAVFSLLVGFIAASWLVSSITTNMTRLSLISNKKNMQFAVLNKYLKEHGISGGLVRRVVLNAKHALAEKEEHMQETDVELLKIVSEPLKAEVHLEIYCPALICHPLFCQLKATNPRGMQNLCHQGVSVVHLEEGDIAFSRGEVPDNPKMMFIVGGELEYCRDGEGSASVKGDQWASEQPLWTDWVYHGSLQATNSCRLAVLDARVFWRLFGPGQMGSLEMAKYATKFVKWQNSGYEARSDIGSVPACVRFIHEVYGKRRSSVRFWFEHGLNGPA